MIRERMKHPVDRLDIEPEHDIVKVKRGLLEGLTPINNLSARLQAEALA